MSLIVSPTMSVAEPEPVEPNLLEIWSRSRNDQFFKIFTAVRLEDARMKKNYFNFHWYGAVCTSSIQQF